MQDSASLRASATLALLMPARLAIRIAQLFSCEQPLTGFVSMTWAARRARSAPMRRRFLLILPV